LPEQEKRKGTETESRRQSVRIRSFNTYRFLSWVSLILILASSLFLSIIIANQARDTLLSKQKEFSLLLAENLNHQIFQRFTLPTLLRFGYISLQNEEQFEQLDSVVRSTIHGQHVIGLRIYDNDQMVSYSMDEAVIGREDLGGRYVEKALESGQHNFEIISDLSPFWSMFTFDLKPGSVVMRIVYPLRAERSIMSGSRAGQIMGILAVSQDITDDYGTVINFQWLIIITSMASSLFLFLMLLIFIRMAGEINQQRIEERERLERELHESEKLASMGRMVAGIAHEIRNPLGIIRSSSELLLSRARAREEEKEARILGAMHDEIKRLGQTVNDFLDYARPKQPRMNPVDPCAVVGKVLVFLDPELKKMNVAVKNECQSGLTVKGDQDLIYRAFYNVLSNAAQAMENGGEIYVRGGSRNGRVEISFIDTGPGFDPQSIENLTDPFFTTKDSGTGLGLAIVANIISGHGGEMRLSNAEGGGARVDISFPKA
jgi:signal transduction histidine kinase